MWMDFDVEFAGGVRETMYLAYLGEGQFIPPVSSVCRIVFERAPIQGFGSRAVLDRASLRNVVDEFTCDTGPTVAGHLPLRHPE
jgi:hypothetical protein